VAKEEKGREREHGLSVLCNSQSSPGVMDLTGKQSKRTIPINELHTNANYFKVI